jgi:hypothetical protein
MFKQAVIHYPSDQAGREIIYKNIAVLRYAETVKYINSLKLNDSQLETLYTSITDSISEINQPNISKHCLNSG